MTQKNLGTGVSSYLDPDLYAFETTVFQMGKPVLDSELNLTGDISTEMTRLLGRKSTPSGWLAEDLLGSSGHAAGVFVSAPAANKLRMPSLTAYVNGWVVDVVNTGEATYNTVDLGAAPVSGGTNPRVDLVILEVWRRLIAAAPDTNGKSHSAKIWRNGNVAVAAADEGLSLTDNIKDGTLGVESTRRVQIQYRLRVIQDVNLFTYPMGIDDTTVFANTVPAAPASPNGTASVVNYAVSSTDPGLWVANHSSLGTVDDNMYAIPLVAVFRRNQAAFDRRLNRNGGSGRPDSSTHATIEAKDIVDLRRGVSLSGWDYREILEKNLSLLLDNNLRTEWETTGDAGGYKGHTVFLADAVGFSPGDSINTGPSGTGASFIGEFDSGRRRFSDRSIYEVITVTKSPSGANWVDGENVTVSISNMDVYPYTGVPFGSRAPTGTKFLDVVGSRFAGTTGSKKGIAAPIASITGLVDDTPTNITLTLGSVSGISVTDETLYIDILIAYPSGEGMIRTASRTFGANSFSINNVGSFPQVSPQYYDPLVALTTSIDSTHREAQMMYRTSDITISLSSESSAVTDKIRMPERLYSVSVIVIGGVTYGGSSSISTDGRTITLNSGTTSPGQTLSITYKAIRPIPENTVQITMYYEALAQQTIRSANLGTSLSVRPRYVEPFLYVITQGSGSPDEGFPFPQAYVQTGGISAGTFTGEHLLNGTSTVSISDFSGSTGLIKILANVPYTPNSEEVSFTRISGDTDAEGRTFFPNALASVYQPSAFGQVLSYPKRHKVFLPAIVELTADTSYARKGTLLLMMLQRWADFDENNFVAFVDSTPNDTSASVFRLKGNLLNRGV